MEHAIDTRCHEALQHLQVPYPDTGFVSMAPAAKWDFGTVVGNGTQGALAFCRTVDEELVLSHEELFLPLFPDQGYLPVKAHYATVRQRVMNCRDLQGSRFHEIPNVRTNSDMGPKVMRQHCVVSDECSMLLEQAMEQLNFSARAHDRILKVARTLADLEESQNIRSPHILESIQYRTLDRSLQL